MINKKESVVIKVPPVTLKISPFGFQKYANQFLEAAKKCLGGKEYNPVPYYLYCRCIELGLKACLLEDGFTIEFLKDKLCHDLNKAMNKIKKSKFKAMINLTTAEKDELSKANHYYKEKGFEYFKPFHAITKYKNLPNLQVLENICFKILKIKLS